MTEQLAKEFSKVLSEWLTADQMREVIARNAVEPNDQICASHDFCDANMAMLEAFERCGLGEADPSDDATLNLWNRVWDLAKATEFAF